MCGTDASALNRSCDFVFTPRSLDNLIDKSTYKPPIEMQIDRLSRKIFRARYYSEHAQFEFTYGRGIVNGSHADALYKWWRSLDDEIQRLLCRDSWISRGLIRVPAIEKLYHFERLEMRKSGADVNYRYRWTGSMEGPFKGKVFAITAMGLLVTS